MYTSKYNSVDEVLDALNKEEIDPYTAHQIMNSELNSYVDNHNVFTMGDNPWYFGEEQEKLYNNLLARYQSKHALTWQAEQLQNLGLSNAGVLQTGASHTAQDFSNVASNKANRLNNIANAFIGMASRMGSAGIHGDSLYAVRNTASQAASTLAHSASSALKSDFDASRANYWADNYMTKEDKDLLKFFDGR